jgi:hypothetical protein
MKKTILAILLASGMSAQGARLNDTTHIMHAEDADAYANNPIAAQIANYRELELSDEAIIQIFRDNGYLVLIDEPQSLVAQDARNEFQIDTSARNEDAVDPELAEALAASLGVNGDPELEDPGVQKQICNSLNKKKAQTNQNQEAPAAQGGGGEFQIDTSSARLERNQHQLEKDSHLALAITASLQDANRRNNQRDVQRGEKSAFDTSSDSEGEPKLDADISDQVGGGEIKIKLNNIQTNFKQIPQDSSNEGMPPFYIISLMEEYLQYYDADEKLFNEEEKKGLTFLNIFGGETADITHEGVTCTLGNDSKTLKGFINALNVLATSPFKYNEEMYDTARNPYTESEETFKTFVSRLERQFNLDGVFFKSEQEKADKIEELIYTKGVLENMTLPGPCYVIGKIIDPQKAMQESANNGVQAALAALADDVDNAGNPLYGVEKKLDMVPVSSLSSGLGCSDISKKIQCIDNYMDRLIDKARKTPVRSNDQQ